MSIDFEDWDVDLKKLSATHSCGFTLTVEGSVKNPSTVHPGPFPKHLSALDQVRLLRHGVEAISKAGRNDPNYREQNNRRYDRNTSTTKVVKKTSSTVNANRAKKPILSLKKKSPQKQPAGE